MNFNKRLISIVLFLVAWGVNLAALPETDWNFFLVGPGLSKHLNDPYEKKYLRNFQPGCGLEIFQKKRHWTWGMQGYYMIEDSKGKPGYWVGGTVGYWLGKRKGFWLHPQVILGGISKDEYHGGRFSIFATPFLAFGYRWLGGNFSVIPPVGTYSHWILFLQVKLNVTFL